MLVLRRAIFSYRRAAWESEERAPEAKASASVRFVGPAANLVSMPIHFV
ncbi:hypothetical protein CPT_MTx_007 [Serratia phage MTx]|uniref:Uncharacterized protein n=1 Tax=Serratia phage MTx TaxID=2557553 RepID=A0A482MGN3_9CAUD|nr:hypothetical protein HWC15_gp007 [Serratia phage MTx]QBQ72313.1 hypothetical protein CPT_MTx_007 [Serratia phage MTx]